MTRSNDETLRAPNGAWKKGTPSPNPNGRPKREIETAALSILAETVTPEIWRGMVAAMIREVAKGNVAAFKALADLYAGKPTERVSIETDNADPIVLKWRALTEQPENSVEDDIPALPAPELGGDHAA